MKKIELKEVNHPYVIGDKVSPIKANLFENAKFTEQGKVVGFYLRNINDWSEKAGKLADIADNELRSDRVPKTEMSRGPQGSKAMKEARKKAGINLVTQWSVILGSIPPKPHMRRNYATISSVHRVDSARNYIKAMKLLCEEAEKIVLEVMPEQYHEQRMLVEKNIPKKYRFSPMFSSSIANCNIAADYHIDKANLVGCVNVIISKKKKASGGNTTIPSYGVTVDSADNAMLVYPAWKSLHGVTPIEATGHRGYRNTLVFYSLGSLRGKR